MNFNKAKKSSGANGRVEDGTYMARIVQVVDLGVQKSEWQGEEKINPQVMITFEFPTETITINDEEKPRWVSKQYTVSMNEKSALYALVNAADPDGKATKKGTNAEGLLGLPVMVTVGSTSGGNAKIAGVSRLMKGMTVPALYNVPVYFDLDSTSAENTLAFEGMPEWLQNKIKEAMNFGSTKFGKGYNGGTVPDNKEETEDNPF